MFYLWTFLGVLFGWLAVPRIINLVYSLRGVQ